MHHTLQRIAQVLFLCAIPLVAWPAEPADAEQGLAGPAQVEAYIQQKKLDEASTLSKSLLAQANASPAVEVETLSSALALMAVTADWAPLDQLAQRAYAASASDAPVEKRIRLLHRLMVVFTRTARFDDAEKAVDAGIALTGTSPSPALLDALRAKGAIHASKGAYPEAIETLSRAQQVNAALGRPEDVGLLRNLGATFLQLKEWNRAIEYLTRAEAVERKNEVVNPERMLGILSVLSAAHIGAGHREEAHRQTQIALDFGRQNGLPLHAILNNQATLFRDEGNFAKALASLEQLKAQMGPRDSPSTLAVVEKNIGETLIALGQRQRAVSHLQAARELYVTADVRSNRLELYPVLIDNLEALGRTAEALTAMREFKTLSDETITTDSQARIGELESKIDLERKTTELIETQAAANAQRAENELLLAQSERVQVISVGLGALLFTLALGLFFSLRYQRIRARDMRELALRNTEIESQRSALQELNTIVEQQNREDALTGLGNRRRFNEAMSATAAGMPETPDLLIMADLDHFKRINDEFGHDVGDRALKHFADILRKTARSHDLAVRWGGEEFVWLCREASPAQGAALCERLLSQLRDAPLLVHGKPLVVSASFGFVPLPVWPGTVTDWETALRIADYGVYCAKAEGRATWVGFSAGSVPELAESLSAQVMEERGHIRKEA
jgi:diguanylate cyclase (GGDEF)-like protein